MLRRKVVKVLTSQGFKLVRSKGGHDIFSNGKAIIPVPRHKEINENTAKEIVRRAKGEI